MGLIQQIILASISLSLCHTRTRKLRAENTVAPDSTNGELFISKLLEGEKFTDTPGYLLFTAPHKLTTCSDGLCRTGDYPNVVMAFPMFIGNNKKNRGFYKSMYPQMPDKNIFKKNISNLYTTKFCITTTTTEAAITKSTVYLGYDPKNTIKPVHFSPKKMRWPQKRTYRTTPSQPIREMRLSDYT